MKTLYSVALMFVLVVPGCSPANNTCVSEEIRAATEQGKETILKTAEDATLTFKDSLKIAIQQAKEEIDEEVTRKFDKNIGALKAEICSLQTWCRNNSVFILVILTALVVITALITKKLKKDVTAEYKQEVKESLNGLRRELNELKKEVKALTEEREKQDKDISEPHLCDVAPKAQSSDVVTPSMDKSANGNKAILYARDSQDGVLNVEDSYSSGKTIFKLILKSNDEAELRICEEAESFILKNGKKELLDTVCECQSENKGDEKVETLFPGKAKRDESGRWRVIQKMVVKFS